MLRTRANLLTKAIGTLALLWSANGITQASTIFTGSSGVDSVQRYTTGGAHLGSFGPSGGTATALDGQGHVYVAQSAEFSSLITMYDATQSALTTITFTGGIENGNGSPGYITDMAYGGGGTLWVAGFNGIVYRISASGVVLSHFDTGSMFTGIAHDGSFLYTSQGLGGGDLYQRMLDGTLVTTIATGLSESFGLGFDAGNGSLWVGGSDVLTRVNSAGMVMNTLAIAGVHNGLEVGDIGTQVIPEPATVLISGLGLAGLVLLKRKRYRYRSFLLPLAFVAVCTSWTPRLNAAITINFTASPAQPEPVGAKITWSVTATDTAAGTLEYRFSVRNPGGVFRIVWDFSSTRTFDWTPSAREGGYEVRVTVRNRSTQATADRTEMYMISSRVTGGVPVVSRTLHPLVALYSAPACPAGSQMRVRFQHAGEVYGQKTPLKPCTPGVSMNFYIAGMRPNTQYSIKHDLFSGPIVITGSTLSFTTGSLPAGFPTYTVRNPADPPSSLAQPVLLHANAGATDLQGRTVWYHPVTGPGVRRPLPGGTFLMHRQDLFLEEVDLVGSVIRQTSVGRVSDQLIAMGKQPITGFHHETFRLPNGNTVVLCYLERIMNNVQGPGPVDILADALVVLDANWQVIWYWNAFDHMDVRRKAVLDEKCVNGQGGCPPQLFLASIANDWLHSNSVSYTTDGHFIMSVRHQDWVIKVNYANGAGSGNVIWRLGKDGDFSINSTDPYPWFSHQHDAEYELGGNQILSLYDNGNTRKVAFPAANSRGQVYRIDEVNRRATLELNADLGVYAFAVGAAQRLLNGNYHFTSGFVQPAGISRSQEVTPSGTRIFELEANRSNYRSFRMRDMYSPY